MGTWLGHGEDIGSRAAGNAAGGRSRSLTGSAEVSRNRTAVSVRAATVTRMHTAADIRSRLEARFTAGWPATLGAPEAWLPHLDELDRQLSMIDPAYRLLYVFTKDGQLRFYVDDVWVPPCCAQWLDAHPVHDGDQAAARGARSAAFDAHLAEPHHDRLHAEQDVRFARMATLIRAAEDASASW